LSLGISLHPDHHAVQGRADGRVVSQRAWLSLATARALIRLHQHWAARVQFRPSSAGQQAEPTFMISAMGVPEKSHVERERVAISAVEMRPSWWKIICHAAGVSGKKLSIRPARAKEMVEDENPFR